ncbi:hypothetical protein CC86DRAFT_379444 [Ophiobolus disseminans]|uniref:Uncharacterized protein n=1 Tax=Ophiobolus disseminans TaxID=1469910 RepID=A0A6A7A9H3_9PLEO|nr:hypothetical protein CC86DRAFT_379444 [Ophiobolus disseminans]
MSIGREPGSTMERHINPEGHHSYTLLENLWLFGAKCCANVADKVYSLVSLSPGGLDITVDYREPVVSVVRSVLGSQPNLCLCQAKIVLATMYTNHLDLLTHDSLPIVGIPKSRGTGYSPPFNLLFLKAKSMAATSPPATTPKNIPTFIATSISRSTAHLRRKSLTRAVHLLHPLSSANSGYNSNNPASTTCSSDTTHDRPACLTTPCDTNSPL